MNNRLPKAGRVGLRLLVLLAAALWWMGMGGGNDSGSTTSVPIPQKNFTATVSDTTGQSLQARRFTWEGKVYFRAQVGNATVSLPFAKLSGLKIEPGNKTPSPDLIRATVTLKTGETVGVMIDRTTKCFGETKFGDYEIFLKDVDTISFE